MAKDAERMDDPNLNQDNDYTEEEMAIVLGHGNFEGWDQVIEWMRNYGAEESALDPGQYKRLLDDLLRLKDQTVYFTSDPNEATVLAKDTRE